MVTNHFIVVFKFFSEAPKRQRGMAYHFIVVAQGTQQMNYRVSEEGKSGGNDTSNVEGGRKANVYG